MHRRRRPQPEGFIVVLCSGAKWLRDSTENCSDVKKVVFFKGHGLRTSTKDFFPIYPNVFANWAVWLSKLLTIEGIFFRIFSTHFVIVPP